MIGNGARRVKIPAIGILVDCTHRDFWSEKAYEAVGLAAKSHSRGHKIQTSWYLIGGISYII